MSIKTTGSGEPNFNAERIRNSGAQFFVCFLETFGAARAPRKTLYLLIPRFSETMD